jgi:hypothetical protein
MIDQRDGRAGIDQHRDVVLDPARLRGAHQHLPDGIDAGVSVSGLLRVHGEARLGVVELDDVTCEGVAAQKAEQFQLKIGRGGGDHHVDLAQRHWPQPEINQAMTFSLNLRRQGLDRVQPVLRADEAVRFRQALGDGGVAGARVRRERVGPVRSDKNRRDEIA